MGFVSRRYIIHPVVILSPVIWQLRSSTALRRLEIPRFYRRDDSQALEMFLASKERRKLQDERNGNRGQQICRSEYLRFPRLTEFNVKGGCCPRTPLRAFGSKFFGRIFRADVLAINATFSFARRRFPLLRAVEDFSWKPFG